MRKVNIRICREGLYPLQFENYELEYNEETTFSELQNRLKLKKYLTLVILEEMYIKRLPFCYIDKKIVWNSEIKDIKIIDYFDTFPVSEEITLIAGVYEVGAAGPNIEMFITAIDWILRIYGLYEIYKTFSKSQKEETEISEERIAKNIVEELRPIQDTVTPDSFSESINNRDEWRLDELSEYSGLSEEVCKYLLTEMGYESHGKNWFIKNTDKNVKFINDKDEKLNKERTRLLHESFKEQE